MADLFADDIEDPTSYTDEVILSDVRALIEIGQRERALIDYKTDISDNWPETAAAFANTFGGLIIFGVEATDDIPTAMPGFAPRGETSTRLTNMLLSRIQPRADFQVRVVKHDLDPRKEVALVRILEGSQPPYMHSKDGEHRVYVRVGARKADADYLQLTALFERRTQVASQIVLPNDFIGSGLRVMEPVGSNRNSPHSYRFIIAPVDSRAGHRLIMESERQFVQCIEQVYNIVDKPWPNQFVFRDGEETYYRRPMNEGTEQRFGVSERGSLGFTTHALIEVNGKTFFRPLGFCEHLVEFLSLASIFYQKRRYYGGLSLQVNLIMTAQAALSSGDPTLFEPPIQNIQANAATQIPVALHPLTVDRLREYLEDVMNSLMRRAGSVLSNQFRNHTRSLIENAFERRGSAS